MQETSWRQWKNILPRSASFASYRRGRDRPLSALKGLRKSARGEVGALLGLLGRFRALVVVDGEGRDDAGTRLVGLG
jgi:hypothetical protein